MNERVELGNGVVGALTGDPPTIYATVTFRCGKMDQTTVRGSAKDSEAILRIFGKDALRSLTGAHLNTCSHCKVPKPPAGTEVSPDPAPEESEESPDEKPKKDE